MPGYYVISMNLILICCFWAECISLCSGLADIALGRPSSLRPIPAQPKTPQSNPGRLPEDKIIGPLKEHEASNRYVEPSSVPKVAAAASVKKFRLPMTTAIQSNSGAKAYLGKPLWPVDAKSSSSFSAMVLAISFEAPFKAGILVSPRLAENAAPAAICWALDLAGIMNSFVHHRR